MNTCGTCKHWKNPYEGFRDPVLVWSSPYDHPKQSEIHEAVNRGDRWGKCRGVAEIPEITVTPETGLTDVEVPLAVTKDGSDYMAELITQAEFGCVLWEDRDGMVLRDLQGVTLGRVSLDTLLVGTVTFPITRAGIPYDVALVVNGQPTVLVTDLHPAHCFPGDSMSVTVEPVP